MKVFWSLFSILLVLTACKTDTSNQDNSKQNAESPTIATETSDLPNLGQAPELTNDIWLNTSQPLRLANLRGQVVLLDMWTFG